MAARRPQPEGLVELVRASAEEPIHLIRKALHFGVVAELRFDVAADRHHVRRIEAHGFISVAAGMLVVAATLGFGLYP